METAIPGDDFYRDTNYVGIYRSTRGTQSTYSQVTFDPSLTVRSVFGQYFPHLVFLDEDWAKNNVGAIFPLNEALQDMNYAAWEAYINFNSPNGNVFEILRDEYKKALDFLGTRETGTRHSADRHLAQHLMVLYARDSILLDEPSGLLEKFYATASDELCGYTLQFIGHSLENSPDLIHPSIIDRFQTFRTHRLEQVRTHRTSTAAVNELTSFGWWFVSKKFPLEWSLLQLKEVLLYKGAIEPHHAVMHRLAEVSATMPTQSIECAELIVDNAREGWMIDIWRDDITTILSNAIAGGDNDLLSKVKAFINRLSARGDRGFEDLLLDK